MPLTAVTYRTVTGSFRRFTGGPAAGTVSFTPSVRVVTSNDDIVVPDPIEATLDASGNFSVSLPVNDDVDMEPTGWTYLVIERIDGEKRSWSFELPTGDGSAVDLADIAPVDPVSPTVSYILASAVAGFATSEEVDAAVDAEAALRAAADTALDVRVDALEVAPPAHAASHENGGSDELELDASQIMTGTIDDARIPATITRDAELTAAVSAAVNAVLDGAPGALDTLNELAAALGDDADFAATVTTALAGKQPLDADLTTLAAGGVGATAWLAALLNATYVGRLGPVLDLTVAPFSVVADARYVRDAVTTSGSPVVTSATAAFTAGDVGKTVVIASTAFAVAGYSIKSTILSVDSATQITLAANAPASLTGAAISIGTDNTAAIQAAIDAAIAVTYDSVDLLLPEGTILTTGTLDASALKGTNKLIRILGRGTGNLTGSGPATGVSKVLNASGATWLKAYGNQASNLPIIGPQLRDLYVQNTAGLTSTTTFTIDFDYCVAQVLIEDVFVDGQNFQGCGIAFRNMAKGQSTFARVHARKFNQFGQGFRIAVESTANSTGINSGNSNFDSCTAEDCYRGWIITSPANLLNGLSFISCKAVNTTDIAGSIGFYFLTAVHACTMIAPHAERFSTGYQIDACRHITILDPLCNFPTGTPDADSAGVRMLGTTFGCQVISGRLTQTHYGVSFEGSAHMNHASGADTSTTRVLTAFFRDTSTDGSNSTEYLDASPTGVLNLAGRAVRVGRSATGSRPSASAAGEGAVWYDTTLDKPVWSDGTNWLDSMSAARILAQLLTVDGAGSGLDADLLDGHDTGYFTGYTDTAIADLIGTAPGVLNTLGEISDAINDDANLYSTLVAAIAAKLDITSYTAADVLAKLLTVDGAGSGLDADLLDGLSSAAFDGYGVATLPSAAVAQTYPRSLINNSAGGVLTSGRMSLFAVYLRAGQTVSTITFTSNSTPAGTPTNQWAALYDSSRVKLRVSADKTTEAWAANTPKTFTLASSYVVPTTGLYYIGLCVVATTVPNLSGTGLLSALSGLAPILSGSSTTGLTDPASAPDPAAALTAHGFMPYAYVS